MEESHKPSSGHVHGYANTETSGPPSSARACCHSEMGLLGLMLLLFRHKTMIGCAIILASVIATTFSMLLPDVYTATTTLLPPAQEQSAAKTFVGEAASLSGLASSDLGLTNPGDLYIAMLKSRSIQDALVDQFSLRRAYSVKTYADARKKLDRSSDILLDKEGLISLSVSDDDPERAVQLAKGYVGQLRHMSRNLAESEAARRRVFYEQGLAAERENLSKAEVALQQTQENTGLVLPDAQERAVIEAVSRTQAELASAEVKLEEMRTFATPDNPNLRRAEVEVAGLRKELDDLEHSGDSLGNGRAEIPAYRLPEANLEYIRRVRDVQYHEALYEFLSKQVEAARIDESGMGATLEVMDDASMPEKRSGPHRMRIVLLTVGVAVLLCCLSIVTLEAARQNKYTTTRTGPLRRFL